MEKDPQPYERANVLSKKQILINNFIGGIAWALGATVGLSLFFTLLSLIGKQVNLVPVVGSFVSQVINFILATNPNFK